MNCFSNYKRLHNFFSLHIPFEISFLLVKFISLQVCKEHLRSWHPSFKLSQKFIKHMCGIQCILSLFQIWMTVMCLANIYLIIERLMKKLDIFYTTARPISCSVKSPKWENVCITYCTTFIQQTYRRTFWIYL